MASKAQELRVDCNARREMFISVAKKHPVSQGKFAVEISRSGVELLTEVLLNPVIEILHALGRAEQSVAKDITN